MLPGWRRGPNRDIPEDPSPLRRLRTRGYGGAQTLSVSKFLQFGVLAPPDDSVSVSKFLQFGVLAPPDNAVSVSKFLQYIVVEAPPLPAALPSAFHRRTVDLDDDGISVAWLRRPRVSSPATQGVLVRPYLWIAL